jgi:4-hydroxy-tetrahydrodipicolinate reductase
MEKMRIAIAGAGGKMGQMLVEAVLAAQQSAGDVQLAALFDAPGAPSVGKSFGGVTVTSDVAAGVRQADVLIDFTRPEGTLHHLEACAAAGTKMVIGTTGFDAAGKAAIAAAAQKTAIVFAANMGVGINVMMKLLELAGKSLAQGYDVEIVETHHRMKVDAPSGTALALGETVAKAMGEEHDAVAEYARHGNTGVRQDGKIGYAVMRGGDTVGDHTVLFMGTGERIEITHRATSRSTYAQGSVRACRFLRDKQVGLFNMQDVLGLSGH